MTWQSIATVMSTAGQAKPQTQWLFSIIRVTQLDSDAAVHPACFPNTVPFMKERLLLCMGLVGCVLLLGFAG
jgi:hypothetical protein